MIYFDCAATSYPKPPKVVEAVTESFARFGGNPGRSGHRLSMDTAAMVFETRELLASFFHAQPENVVFTMNCTHALNLALKGVLQKGDHVITSSLEHNSMIRPLDAMQNRGEISYSIANVGLFSIDETVENVRRLLKPNTKLLAMTHASNVTGTLLPLRELGALAHENGALFLVDAAQSAGVIPIDMEAEHIDILCLPGHKGLYGPMGIGAMILREGLTLNPLMEGGTGTESLSLSQPLLSPERYESGTVNVPGIAGLKAGVSFLQKEGRAHIFSHESELCSFVTEELRKLSNIHLTAGGFLPGRNAPIVSFSVGQMDSSEAAAILSEKGFLLRGGFHCAGTAHRYLKTELYGTVRFSPGFFNTLSEAEQFLNTVKKL